jgi:23S rRNA pseudouridine1911/1915/1917 synthase
MDDLNQGWIYRDQVQPDAEGMEVLQFYVRSYPHSPPEIWRERLESGLVRLDGRPARPDERLRAGQRLAYHRPPWREERVPQTIEILYEDDHLVAVAKPAGLPVLPGAGFLENTLLFMVHRRYPDRPSPVHRLGRGTSGVILFARSPAARRQLSAELAAGCLAKTYRALASGVGMPDTFAVEVPIGEVPYPPVGRIHAAAPDGKPSRTECRVLERRPAGDQTLVEVQIPTGRAHQIRIHLAAAGHPLVGDPLYRPGGVPVDPPRQGRAPLPGDGGYHLHALRVAFVHPGSGGRLVVTCPPPAILRTGRE